MKIHEGTERNIGLAAAALKKRELVVVPTETVYGLAADATNSIAVAKIFRAKGRPGWNPLIVHVNQLEDAAEFADISAAQTLSRAFSPGPISFVLPYLGGLASDVLAGGNTVAVRIPAHPTFRALLNQCQTPLAAPSANLFTRVSPTRAQDIPPEILRSCWGVLDGGECQVGIESTVIDLTESVPVILRPGEVSKADIERVLGEVIQKPKETSSPRSPGQHPLHYAPKSHLELVLSSEISKMASIDRIIRHKNDSKAFQKVLYSELIRLDRESEEPIFIEAPPQEPEWDAVWDRLRRALNA